MPSKQTSFRYLLSTFHRKGSSESVHACICYSWRIFVLDILKIKYQSYGKVDLSQNARYVYTQFEFWWVCIISHLRYFVLLLLPSKCYVCTFTQHLHCCILCSLSFNITFLIHFFLQINAIIIVNTTNIITGKRTRYTWHIYGGQ